MDQTFLAVGADFRWRRFARTLMAWALLMPGILAHAQNFGRDSSISRSSTSRSVVSGSAPIALQATLPSALTLSISNVLLNIPVDDPGEPSEIVAVPITSSWILNSSTVGVELVAYFDSPGQALSDEANHVIPADRVLGALNDEHLAPFVETSREGTAGASRTLFRQPISRGNTRGSRADTIRIQLKSIADLGAPQGNYRGILNLRLVSY
ncbi:MAG TPA: hypothetical protein VN911_20720 [Candidatus Acidoferrum sp.]|nr:hypothetical protein [Candidatus Acidoferrum sp.]